MQSKVSKGMPAPVEAPAPAAPKESLAERVERLRLEVEAHELELKLRTLQRRTEQLPAVKEL